MDVFYEIRNIPVHSCLMFDDPQEAKAYSCRDLSLGLCKKCGFISNITFDPTMRAYGGQCEDQQAFSPRFRVFQAELIDRLIERYDLRNKDVLEIGCGKGDFLVDLCAAGNNRGIGIDPACVSQRMADRSGDRVRFITDYYSEAYAHLKCDFLCCRHTLEHIPPVDEFVSMVRNAIGKRLDTVIFFDLPAMERVLHESAFWDIYYEHCSYFAMGSMARLFRRNRFDIIELTTDYDNQYLTLLARPVDHPTKPAFAEENDLADIIQRVDRFSKNVTSAINAWRGRLNDLSRQRKRVAIWGSGSKCVSFLSALGESDQSITVVDINPYRHGKYIAGSGMQVMAPDALRTFQPHVVFVMNPIYRQEIQQDLEAMGVTAELIPV